MSHFWFPTMEPREKHFEKVESVKMREADDEIVLPCNVKNSEKVSHTTRREICKCFSEYSGKTSIHGIQYLGETNRPLCERIFWTMVFIVSIYFCSTMIYQLWRKWNDTPIIVSFDERQTEIWKIPFPSITICPQIKMNSDLFSYERVMKEFRSGINLTNEEIKNLNALATVCDSGIYNDVPPYNGETLNIVDTLYSLQEGTIQQLEMQFQNVEHEIELSPILTEIGICYNFNGLSIKDMYTDECEVTNLGEEDKNSTNWHREEGYKGDYGRYAYPWRSFGSGIFLGFSIHISHTKNVDNACTIPPDGFKVIIHSPDNMPIVSSKYFNLPANQQVIVAVQPSLLWTSDELRSYSPQKRQCFFSNERHLKFFKVYTQVNCLMECRTQYTFLRCNCVSFYMPRSKDMNICVKSEDIQCSHEAQEEFLMSEIEPNRTKRQEIHKMKEKCNCLSPCSTIMYNTEISQNKMDLSKIVKAVAENDNFTQNWFDENVFTHLTVFYKESEFLSSKRSELYGISEFIANCGGLLGLFMGISAISFVELFYFSIIRVISNIIQARNIRN